MVVDLGPTDSVPLQTFVLHRSLLAPLGGWFSEFVGVQASVVRDIKVRLPSISRTSCALESCSVAFGNRWRGRENQWQEDLEDPAIVVTHKRYRCWASAKVTVLTLLSAQLRCGGEKPSCTRCTRLARPCVYKPVGAATVARRRASSIASSHRPVPVSEYIGSPSRLHISEKKYFGVPSTLLPTLIDLYFKCIYNARLLFHRPSLEVALEAQSVRSDIVLCICAMAAK